MFSWEKINLIEGKTLLMKYSFSKLLSDKSISRDIFVFLQSMLYSFNALTNPNMPLITVYISKNIGNGFPVVPPVLEAIPIFLLKKGGMMPSGVYLLISSFDIMGNFSMSSTLFI